MRERLFRDYYAAGSRLTESVPHTPDAINKENYYALALAVYEKFLPDEALGMMGIRPKQAHRGRRRKGSDAKSV